jgi:hypothetical protein
MTAQAALSAYLKRENCLVSTSSPFRRTWVSITWVSSELSRAWWIFVCGARSSIWTYPTVKREVDWCVTCPSVVELLDCYNRGFSYLYRRNPCRTNTPAARRERIRPLYTVILQGETVFYSYGKYPRYMRRRAALKTGLFFKWWTPNLEFRPQNVKRTTNKLLYK